MKRGGIVSLKRFNSFISLGKNRLFIFICFTFILGIIIGNTSLFANSKASGYADDLFEAYINSRQGIGFFNIFISSLSKYTAACFVFYIFGVSIFGIVVSPILSCLLGIYYGILSAFAYSTLALKGVAFNAIILIPAALIFSLCVFFSAKESFVFSLLIVKLILPKSRPLNLSSEFRTYCGKYLVVLSFIVLSALADAAVSVSFLKFFTF